jgi:ribosomal protein L40E
MIVVVVAELIYFIRRRRKKMKLRRTQKGESLSDKAHNLIMTTESISASLTSQGIQTAEANALITEAKRFEAMRDFSSAIERAEAAKLALIRAKREQNVSPAAPANPPTQGGLSMEDEEELVDLSKLPKNYMQAKFILNSAKDLLEKDGIKSGEAFDNYQKAKEHFEAEEYSKALTLAIKAERILDSDTVGLIGEEEADEVEEEVVEVQVCPECDNEVSPDDAFCRSCGQKLEFISACPGCEADIESDDKFCRKCGHSLD